MIRQSHHNDTQFFSVEISMSSALFLLFDAVEILKYFPNRFNCYWLEIYQMFLLFIRNFSKTKPLFPQIVELEFLYEIQNMKHVSLCE